MDEYARSEARRAVSEGNLLRRVQALTYRHTENLQRRRICQFNDSVRVDYQDAIRHGGENRLDPSAFTSLERDQPVQARRHLIDRGGELLNLKRGFRPETVFQIAGRYQPGAFLDARHPECKQRNEANLVGFESARGRFAVRQVAGLIARRIVCPLQVGQELQRGGRMGMIKFGSRTELYVPAEQAVRVEVEVGQAVKGALTILFRYEA